MDVNKLSKEIQLKKQLVAMEKDTEKRNKLSGEVKKLEVKKQIAQLKKGIQ
jgi:hypothetical protein